MPENFKYIIVGRGMMGAAAARHLAERTDGVAVIGPGEPKDIKTHQGVFASHYDEARITRTIDPDADWALLANRSIARYEEISRESGIDFYKSVGCLMVGPKRGGANQYIDQILGAADKLGVETELMGGDALKSGFPYFSFAVASEGVHQATDAGYINPRALVEAQSILARKNGATLIDDIVTSVREENGLAVVTAASGQTYKAEKVLVAAGGFSITENLLPQPIALSVYARTVAFFEIPEYELEQYDGMPSLIYEPANPKDHIYMLPPVRYPDGKVYMKIGGDPDDLTVGSDPEMRAWFRKGGREEARDHLSRITGGLVPSIDLARVSMAACVVSKTPGGYPAIGFTSSPRVAVLTGGCGAAAKSSDEIGRLGAQLIFEGAIHDLAYENDFRPEFLA